LISWTEGIPALYVFGAALLVVLATFGLYFGVIKPRSVPAALTGKSGAAA
jgi:hypothetical protein